MPLDDLPELVAFESHAEGVRVPPGVTVPLTPRVRSLIDTAEMRRLARVSQLGLVSLVYPGAVHSRFEHSLGAFRMALAFLARLRHDPRFAAVVGEGDAAALAVAALVHDIGHWPYCHPIEDIGLAEIPRHEELVHGLLAAGEPARILAGEWGVDPARVAALVTGTAADPAGGLLHSLLSGPIDVDKIDYLQRDSLHAGVPYGRNFDEERLLSSLCVDEHGTALAITDKGRTAAEMLVFARYVMFSEVYWHPAVRCATAMLQRAVWLLRDRLDPPTLVRLDDPGFVAALSARAAGTPADGFVSGLFGPTRRLLKRAASFDALRHPEVHRRLSGRPYGDAVGIAARLAAALERRTGTAIAAETLLIDAPPAEREVEFTLAVRERPRRGGSTVWRSFADLSPVVRALAHEQFDDLVKRVRIFAPAGAATAIAACPDLERILIDAAMGSEA